MARSWDDSPTFLEEYCLDEDILVTSLELTLMIESSRCINAMILHSLVSRVREYNMRTVRKIERMGRIIEIGKIEDERGRTDDWRNKVNSVVNNIIGSDVSDYYHIIY